MTEKELAKIPFRCVGHLALAHEHLLTYVSEDGRLGFCDHTPKRKNGTFGKSRRHYRIDNKTYKSKQKFIEALKDFNPDFKCVSIFTGQII